MNIEKEAIAEFNAGNGTVDATEQPLHEVGVNVNKHVVVRADSGIGSETITVGPTGRAAQGFVLNPGEQTPPIYVDNTDKIGVIGSTTNLAYSWIAN